MDDSQLLQLCKMGDIHKGDDFEKDSYDKFSREQRYAHVFWQFGDLDTMLNACEVTASIGKGNANKVTIGKPQLRAWAEKLGLPVSGSKDALAKHIIKASRL